MPSSEKTFLLLGTGNRKKLEELKTLLSDIPFRLVSLREFPNIKEVKEDGDTFEENAVKKATGLAKQTGMLTLAEDSGLMVEALEGNPGVYSARFAGPEKDDLKNCLKILKLMEKLPENCRGASFKSVVAITTPQRLIGTAVGEVHGGIAHQMRGSGGFGYDPIFIYGPYGKTFGEVSAEMKHRVSHRAQAVLKAKKILEEYAKIRTPAGG
ncbi:MAG: RdgB/HAM1 family non-canonical purine NTP pyrophosphatase [Candidatus Omnitrophica bacterium]|nr:RdgB/HAM1 family non-canonical purine NTP pyrophosphatase [Candidatus Omnitrophota bacterium]